MFEYFPKLSVSQKSQYFSKVVVFLFEKRAVYSVWGYNLQIGVRSAQ